MKRILFLLTMTALISFGASFASYAGEQNTATANQTQEKKQYEQSMEKRLANLGRKLDLLRARAATLSEQARKDMDRDIADAEKKQEVASRKLQEIRKESSQKWKKFVSEMNAATDDFEQAFERAKSHFKD